MTSRRERRAAKNIKEMEAKDEVPDTEPDWEGKCEVCGASPIVPCTGMCGPCTFGEANTVNGEW